MVRKLLNVTRCHSIISPMRPIPSPEDPMPNSLLKKEAIIADSRA